ncbi:MAG: hypothetical protein K0R55_3589 [Sporomusa sp.]|nr:hypothetical protein [Sporomusa sp.]
MTLEQRVINLEKEVADLKRQIEGPNQQEELRSALRLAELRKMRMQKRFDATNPAERQAFLDALAKLDCYIQSLPQRYQ